MIFKLVYTCLGKTVHEFVGLVKVIVPVKFVAGRCSASSAVTVKLSGRLRRP